MAFKRKLQALDQLPMQVHAMRIMASLLIERAFCRVLVHRAVCGCKVHRQRVKLGEVAECRRVV